MQALDAGRHAPGADTGNLGHFAHAVAILDVLPVRGLVLSPHLFVGGEHLIELDHHADRFEARRRSDRLGVAKVVEGRKRAAVGQARRRRDDRGRAVERACGDADHSPGLSAELLAHRGNIGLGGGLIWGSWHYSVFPLSSSGLALVVPAVSVEIASARAQLLLAAVSFSLVCSSDSAGITTSSITLSWVSPGIT